jgi:hypothetical protein
VIDETRALSRLKVPALRRYDSEKRGGSMFSRVALILGVIALGLTLDGCTKCGPIWDDWMQSPNSCKSDRF